MSEPSKVRGKSKNQLNAQLDRIWDRTNEAYRNSRTNEERRRITDRWNRVADTYNRYMDSMNSSGALTRAVNRYAQENGTLANIGAYLDDVSIPRSQYMRRRNNRG